MLGFNYLLNIMIINNFDAILTYKLSLWLYLQLVHTKLVNSQVSKWAKNVQVKTHKNVNFHSDSHPGGSSGSKYVNCVIESILFALLLLLLVYKRQEMAPWTFVGYFKKDHWDIWIAESVNFQTVPKCQHREHHYQSMSVSLPFENRWSW